MMNRQIGAVDFLAAASRVHCSFVSCRRAARCRLPAPVFRRFLPFAFCLLPFAFLSGCSPTYVLQAGYEEAKILWNRRPIEEVLQRTNLDGPTREKLQLVLRVRQFAEQELGFRVGGSYSSLAEVKQPPIAYVLTAAPRTRLEPY